MLSAGVAGAPDFVVVEECHELDDGLHKQLASWAKVASEAKDERKIILVGVGSAHVQRGDRDLMARTTVVSLGAEPLPSVLLALKRCEASCNITLDPAQRSALATAAEGSLYVARRLFVVAARVAGCRRSRRSAIFR